MRPKRRFWRFLRFLIWTFLILVIAVVVGGRFALAPITAYVEAKAVRHLNQNGVYPRYVQRSWLPWRGLRLDGVTLYRNTQFSEPVVEVSSIDVTFPWYHIWRIRQLVSVWNTHDATITFHDTTGPLTFTHVTAHVILEPGELEASHLQFTKGALAVALTGKIYLPPPVQPAPPPGNFTLDLGAVRAVEATLDIKPGTGPLQILGDFEIDARQPAVRWTSNLKGSGKKLEWQGIPLLEANASAKLSQDNVSFTSDLRFRRGSAKLQASRQDWDRSPLVFEGSIADAANRRDQIAGSYGGDPAVVTLTRVRGRADLLEFARNFPALVSYLPTGLQVRTFPDLSLTKLSFELGNSRADWSLASFELLSPAQIGMTLGGKPVTIEQLTGKGSYRDGTWRLSNMAGNALGARFTLSGAYAQGEVRDAELNVDNLQLKQLDPWIGKEAASFSEGRLFIDYRGTISPLPSHLTGSGTVRMENAPVVKMRLLDAISTLFSALEPRVRRNGVGSARATFSVSRGVVNVSEIAAGSESIDVTGKGTIDLVNRRVDGRASGRLRGIPGLLTSPISKALEVKITGPLDQINVQSVTPLQTVGEGVVGAAKLPGKILKEGVSVPGKLLDLIKGDKDKPEPKVSK